MNIVSKFGIKSINDQVLDIIFAEQDRQSGLYIPSDHEYVQKLCTRAELLIHQDLGGVLGFIFFYCNAPDKSVSYVSLVGTSLEARGKGVGRALLNQVLFISKERGFSFCRLEVRNSNVKAFNFYEKMGFASIEDRGEKYLMCKSLK